MATHMDHRPPRLSLAPLWGPHDSPAVGPYYTPFATPTLSRGYSPPLSSPKSLPTPVLPSGVYDGGMRQHERAMVERLDSRIRQAKSVGFQAFPHSPSASRPLSPVAEDELKRSDKGKGIAMPSLPSVRELVPQPPLTPLSPPSAAPPHSVMVPESRSMALAKASSDAKRRQSAPINVGLGISHQSMKKGDLEQLRAWGHVYLGDARSADTFVQAVSYKPPQPRTAASGYFPQARSMHTTVRARVRPRDVERKPFLIQREFNIEELRATVADPVTAAARPPSIRPSPLASPQGPSSPKSARGMMPPPMEHARRRSSSFRHDSLSPRTGPRMLSERAPRAPTRGSQAMPIHLEYARAHLPVLAALMVSGHVREGDVIDLPLPHPEAWPKTVSYVYTGQGELTEAIRANIIHLAGKTN